MAKTVTTSVIPVHAKLFRGAHTLRIALVGAPYAGKRSLFQAVSSTAVRVEPIAGTQRRYQECAVQVGLDQARLINLPSLRTLGELGDEDQPVLKYLLWGDERPPVSAHEPQGAPVPFAPPDLIIQVIDATALERHLELTFELMHLSRPLVIALNKMDLAREKRQYVSAKILARRLGIPVVPLSAVMGQGIAALFTEALATVRRGFCPMPVPPAEHIRQAMFPLARALRGAEIQRAFRVPLRFLLMQAGHRDRWFFDELREHFPERVAEIERVCAEAGRSLPRPLDEELHADRHHRAASLAEAVTRPGGGHERRDWRYWVDEFFLNPRWGGFGGIAVFAGVLFVVFIVSAWIDSLTSARLVEWASAWKPDSTQGVVGHAVLDALIGLVGIAVPYMIPLVLLMVGMEQAGIMSRIAFTVDRGFHRIGLNGGVAGPFLLGLGCNVPALTGVAGSTTGRERLVASLLIAFVPCSARSAIILALAGKYLGAPGVLAVFFLVLMVIALLGKLLQRRYQAGVPGQVQEIPPITWPRWRELLFDTWDRTRDVLTVVAPLLIAGSIVLALLDFAGADDFINLALTPITQWWLGLPLVLGVPILFGVLRKELSLLMVYQALGTFEIDRFLDAAQLLTFLLFLTLYVPCISTFAVMLKTLGRRDAWYSVSLSIGVALAVSGIVRFAMLGVKQLAG